MAAKSRLRTSSRGSMACPICLETTVALAEVDDLIDQLTSSPKAAVAGLTGEGGTGKSVLASAVAHEVHSRFAAGVHWVTVGEHATSEDVRQMQQELLISLGEPMATQLRDP